MDRREYIARARAVALHQAERIIVGNYERIQILSDDHDLGGDSIVISEPTCTLAGFDLTREEAGAIVNDLCGLA